LTTAPAAAVLTGIVARPGSAAASRPNDARPEQASHEGGCDVSKADHLAAAIVVAVAVILCVAVLLGFAARKLRQPAVIGQIVAGITLGPSVLGRMPGNLSQHLFPATALPVLSVLSQVGVVMFMVAVGYELNLRRLAGRQQSVAAVSVGAFATPMALGAVAALILLGGHDHIAQHRGSAAAFIGYFAVAMSITAVPVLASILQDRRMQDTTVGAVSLTAAGAMDVVAWLVLAMVVGSTGTRPIAEVWGLTLLYAAVMVAAVRPALRWWVNWRPANDTAFRGCVMLALAMGSAWVTAELGLHFIFGALLFGLIMPRKPSGLPDSELIMPISSGASMLLPIFFVTAGFGVNIEAMGAGQVALLVVLIAVGFAGKVGGGLLAARASGMGWLEAYRVGALMNSRGLTELIALNIGLTAGLIGTQMYTVLVLMALALTAMTGPLLSWADVRSDPSGLSRPRLVKPFSLTMRGTT
jgi:Kef-type K+ transport system membrane component KefB